MILEASSVKRAVYEHCFYDYRGGPKQILCDPFEYHQAVCLREDPLAVICLISVMPQRVREWVEIPNEENHQHEIDVEIRRPLLTGIKLLYSSSLRIAQVIEQVLVWDEHLNQHKDAKSRCQVEVDLEAIDPCLRNIERSCRYLNLLAIESIVLTQTWVDSIRVSPSIEVA